MRTAGVATPDHTIRTKNYPLIVPPPEAGRLDDFAASVAGGRRAFRRRLSRLFCPAQHSRRTSASSTRRRGSSWCRGSACSGSGAAPRTRAIAADLAESWVATVTDAEAVGRFQSISEAEMFDIEYWSLEQAKLAGAVEKPLAGQVALITGGAGTIGAATARALRGAGAEIVLLDRAGTEVEAAAKKLGGLGIACRRDRCRAQCAPPSTRSPSASAESTSSCRTPAPPGRAGSARSTTRSLRESFELNFFAHQTVAQNAVRIMLAQGTGGCLLFNVSKQAVNPGPNSGPYGLPKAATLLLMRQYALDYGAAGIRANAVNADRIRGGLLTPAIDRGARRRRAASARTTTWRGNLLGREVTAEDVAQAFLDLALARNTTGSFATVDGGNIAAAPR